MSERGRIMMKDGKWSPDVTPEERKRLLASLVPPPEEDPKHRGYPVPATHSRDRRKEKA